MRNNSNNYKLVQLIAIWMLLGIYPCFQFFLDRGFMPQSLLEGLGILGIALVAFCAIGLIFTKEIARFFSVWVSIVYFFWGFYIVCFNIAPSFSLSVEWLSSAYHIPLESLKSFMLFLLVTHMMWPLIVTMYLTNPSVKAVFRQAMIPEAERDVIPT